MLHWWILQHIMSIKSQMSRCCTGRSYSRQKMTMEGDLEVIEVDGACGYGCIFGLSLFWELSYLFQERRSEKLVKEYFSTSRGCKKCDSCISVMLMLYEPENSSRKNPRFVSQVCKLCRPPSKAPYEQHLRYHQKHHHLTHNSLGLARLDQQVLSSPRAALPQLIQSNVASARPV